MNAGANVYFCLAVGPYLCVCSCAGTRTRLQEISSTAARCRWRSFVDTRAAEARAHAGNGVQRAAQPLGIKVRLALKP